MMHIKKDRSEGHSLNTIIFLIENTKILPMLGHDKWYSIQELAKTISDHWDENGGHCVLNSRRLMMSLRRTGVVTGDRDVKQVKVKGRHVSCVYLPLLAVRKALKLLDEEG